jgi:hypothetical protein
MSANINPIFIGTPNFGFTATITAANTNLDGTGTVNTVFTAGANGSYVRRLRVKAQGTNQANVMRIWINNGSTQTTASNNTYWGELALSASTASANAMAGPDYEYPLNLVLKAGYAINVSMGSTAAGGWLVSAEGGDY